MTKFKKKILYLTFDGLSDPLGRSQIFPLINNLSKKYEFNIISFEKEIFYKEYKNSIQHTTFQKNVKHHIIQYNKSKFLKFFSLLIFTQKLIKFIFFKKIDLIHIRGYQSILFLLPFTFFKNIKIIFDIRGFWPDEKVDRSNWKRFNIKFKLFKKLEHIVISYSKAIVCLTENSKSIIKSNFNFKKNKIFVIPTCSSQYKFNLNNKNISNNPKDYQVTNIGYLGTTSGAYNFENSIIFIKTMIENKFNIVFNIYTFDEFDKIIYFLNKYKISPQYYNIKSIQYNDIQNYIKKNDFMIFYLNKNYSIQASFPTKISEILLCGIPIICNAFNSDIKSIIDKNDFFFEFDYNDIDINKIKNFIVKINNNRNIYEKKINEFAKKNFESSISFKKYENIYNLVLNE